MRMHGFSGLVQSGGGSLPRAFSAAFVGPASAGSTIVGNPVGAGGVITTTFNEDGPVATYDDMRDGVRYGWPIMFALGWAGSYLAWRWWWQKTGKLNLGGKGYFSGLMGTPDQHRETFDTLIGTAGDLVRRGHLKNAHDYVTRAYQEARWFKMNSSQADAYRRLYAQSTKR